MTPAALPPDEPARLAALEATGLLDTPPEREFDDVTLLASIICETPIALVSLVDARRQWSKSRLGLDVSELPRGLAFCSHAILGRELFEVPDAADDERFRDNPLVTGGPRLRSYAGAPLVTREGYALGTLCVLDRVPRTLMGHQRLALDALARQVVALITARSEKVRLAQANAEMHEARRRLEFLLDDTHDLIHTLGADGHLVYANRAWRETFGWSEHELHRVHALDVVLPERREATAAFLAAPNLDDRPVDIDLDFQTRAGARRRLVGKVRRRLVDGEVQTHSVLTDVTHQRRLDDSVRAHQAELGRALGLQRAILDAANLSIIATDVDGLIVTFSAGARRMLGFRADEMLGRTPVAIHLAGEIEARARELTRELGRHVAPSFEAFIAKARQGEVDEREWTYVRADGSTLPVLLSVTALRGASGELTGYLGVARDITDLKQVDRLKDEFVSTVSHELRTPLTSIRGALGLVEGGVLGEVPAAMLEVVGIARSNCDRLIRLVNEILDLEKMGAGKLELRPEPLLAHELVAQALAQLEALARGAGVRLRARAAEGIAFPGDRDRLLQVLTNLLSNAIKWSAPQSTVFVDARSLPGQVRFQVVDTGRGIAAEKVPLLFERFLQLDPGDARRKGGSGLGLAISKGIVEQHGGRIGVWSERGHGATFWFELPRAPAAPAPVAEPERALPAGDDALRRALRRNRDEPVVLVVEDDADTRAVIATQLRGLGVRCVEAADGPGALECVQDEQPDLVVLDVNLPHLDGFGVVGALRGGRADTTPLLVYTGRDLDARERGALTLGSTRHLTKARASDQEFLAAVRELLSGLLPGPAR